MKIWKQEEGEGEKSDKKWQAFIHKTFKKAVTAVAFAPSDVNILAVGLEDGSISIWRLTLSELSLVYDIPASLCHVEAVKRLAWRAPHSQPNKHSFQLASCSDDHSVRIFTLHFAA